MGSEDFITKFPQAHAIFLSYLISNHCPTVLLIPKAMQVRKMEEFEGCHMFKTVKKLKGLKICLK